MIYRPASWQEAYQMVLKSSRYVETWLLKTCFNPSYLNKILVLETLDVCNTVFFFRGLSNGSTRVKISNALLTLGLWYRKHDVVYFLTII